LPSSDRYALLTPCGDAPDCWIYTIRSGDNLVSIANYFGVPFDTVTERNPWTRTTQLVAGQELRLPPPTR
jgi:spore germination protein YaaH